MRKAEKVLKGKNIRATPQRLEVYRILRETAGHLTAEEVYARSKRLFPAISLATVYTILELLKSKQLVDEIRINFGRSCFELKDCEHHHFLCNRCGRIFDIDIVPCPTLKKRQVDGHVIETFQGYFYGTCKDCKDNEDAAR